MLKLLKSGSGEGYIDVAVLVLCVMLVIALAVSVLPVFVTKTSWTPMLRSFAGRQRLPGVSAAKPP